MADNTTIMLSTETKTELESLKRPKESYDKLLMRMMKAGTDTADPRYVSLKMSPEEYAILRNRQTWPICEQILVENRQ